MVHIPASLGHHICLGGGCPGSSYGVSSAGTGSARWTRSETSARSDTSLRSPEEKIDEKLRHRIIHNFKS